MSEKLSNCDLSRVLPSDSEIVLPGRHVFDCTNGRSAKSQSRTGLQQQRTALQHCYSWKRTMTQPARGEDPEDHEAVRSFPSQLATRRRSAISSPASMRTRSRKVSVQSEIGG